MPSGFSSSTLRRLALGIGAASVGAYVGAAVARRWRQRQLPAPSTLPKALDAEARTLECTAGRANYYVRTGTGRPIVFVHSFNAAASSFEWRPAFERFAATTHRPLYAMDWIGFGRSAREDVEYTPALYERQLYRFLRTVVDAPADVVALSLGCEVAARVGLRAAPLVHRLALVAPTGLAAARGPSLVGRIGLSVAHRTGAFELLFARLTRRASLRQFYARQVFLDPAAVPGALVEYAHVTTHARGAHHAPRYFINGTLFTDDVAPDVYARLYRPTLLLTPEHPAETVQAFDRLPQLLAANERDLQHQALPGGLLPHWEAPQAFFDALEPWVLRDG